MRETRSESIGLARLDVLLEQRNRQTPRSRSQHRRQRTAAAEPDDDIGTQLIEQPARLTHAARQGQRQTQPGGIHLDGVDTKTLDSIQE